MYGATVTSAQPATTSSVPLGRPYRRPPLKAIELASTMSAQTGKMWLSAPKTAREQHRRTQADDVGLGVARHRDAVAGEQGETQQTEHRDRLPVGWAVLVPLPEPLRDGSERQHRETGVEDDQPARGGGRRGRRQRGFRGDGHPLSVQLQTAPPPTFGDIRYVVLDIASDASSGRRRMPNIV